MNSSREILFNLVLIGGQSWKRRKYFHLPANLWSRCHHYSATIPCNQCIPRAKRPLKRLEGLNHFLPIAVQNPAGIAHFEVRFITVSEMFARREDAQTISRSGIILRLDVFAGWGLPALMEIPFSVFKAPKKRLLPLNNRDLPPRKNQNTLDSNVFRSHEAGIPSASLYHLIIQVFVQSCAGREALSTESARFRTAKDERPSPVAGLFFRNHTLARHRPNRGPTANITKALHKAIRIHHLRTLGHSIGVRSDTNSDIAKKNASDLCLSRVGSPRCFRNRPALLPLPKRLVQFKGGGVRRGQRALSEYMAKGHRR